MSTLRTKLTLAEGSLLASMFSGKWEDKMTKDKLQMKKTNKNQTEVIYFLLYNTASEEV
jgi:hypothetical protein